MKKTLLSIITMATLSLSALGQAPEGFKYQAVVRDAANLVLTNQNVGIQLTILQGSASGTSVYSETFSPITNGFGLVNIEIGSGTTSDNFSTIDWANGPYFIETAVDITGGTSYSVMGTSQLMSVPYALHAKTADNVTNDQVNDADADPSNEIQNIQGSSLSGTNLTIGIQGGSNQTVDLSSLQDGTGTDDQNIQGSGLSGSNLTIGIQGGSNQIVDLSPLQKELVDADGDTKIQVEQSTDDDVIRFDVEGIEYFRFVKGRINLNNTGYTSIFGQSAGVNDDFTNNHNSYFGYYSGNANVNSFGNSSFGSNSLRNHTSGDFNVALGYRSMFADLSGTNNVALGSNSLENGTNSNNNVAIGTGALTLGSNLNNNVAIGMAAGQSSTGSNNIFIGFGAGAFENNDNKLYIENTASTLPLIYGEFDNDLIRINGNFQVTGPSEHDLTVTSSGIAVNHNAPAADLDIAQSSMGTGANATGGIKFNTNPPSGDQWRLYNDSPHFSFNNGPIRVAYIQSGTGAWLQPSDSTLKKNITVLPSVLNRVMKMNAVNYHYKNQSDSERKITGFIAQEVEQLFPELISHSNGKLAMSYANTGVIAIKAVQEQQEIINAQQEEIDLLKSKLEAFQTLLETLVEADN